MTEEINQKEETRYNVRARVPHFAEVFKVWHTRSAEFRAQATMKTIRYGAGEKATLDLFLPDTLDKNKPAPLQLFIHGGYWQAMDKDDFSFIAQPFVKEGVCVGIVNYDLCPDVTLAHIVEQMKEAVIWAWQNGSHHGFDPQAIHVSGHSAGGHLVAMLLATDWAKYNVPDTVIKSCVALSGIFDLKPLVQTTINTALGLSEAEAKRLSPYGKSCIVHCPVLSVYGDQEGDGFALQSQQMLKHWLLEGLRAENMPLDGANHFDACEALTVSTSPVFRWVMKEMKKSSP